MSVRSLSPRAEALAFRIWQVAHPVDWCVSLTEVAAVLGESVEELRRVCRRKGWQTRLAPDGTFEEYGA